MWLLAGCDQLIGLRDSGLELRLADGSEQTFSLRRNVSRKLTFTTGNSGSGFEVSGAVLANHGKDASLGNGELLAEHLKRMRGCRRVLVVRRRAAANLDREWVQEIAPVMLSATGKRPRLQSEQLDSLALRDCQTVAVSV